MHMYPDPDIWQVAPFEHGLFVQALITIKFQIKITLIFLHINITYFDHSHMQKGTFTLHIFAQNHSNFFHPIYKKNENELLNVHFVNSQKSTWEHRKKIGFRLWNLNNFFLSSYVWYLKNKDFIIHTCLTIWSSILRIT